MTVSTGDAGHIQNAGTSGALPMMAVGRSDGDSVVATQVVVTDTNGGEHTLVACPAQLVDYDHTVPDSV